jgi:hypothetical protein
MWVFDPAELPQPNDCTLVHVGTWPADERCDVTGFNTLGMSERSMPGADYYTELHMAVRGRLGKDRQLGVAGFLANVAQYPL